MLVNSIEQKQNPVLNDPDLAFFVDGWDAFQQKIQAQNEAIIALFDTSDACEICESPIPKEAGICDDCHSFLINV